MNGKKLVVLLLPIYENMAVLQSLKFSTLETYVTSYYYLSFDFKQGFKGMHGIIRACILGSQSLNVISSKAVVGVG